MRWRPRAARTAAPASISDSGSVGNGVVGDYREPEALRFGVTPLYLGYADVWDAVETLRRVLDEELWRAEEFQVRGTVT